MITISLSCLPQEVCLVILKHQTCTWLQQFWHILWVSVQMFACQIPITPLKHANAQLKLSFHYTSAPNHTDFRQNYSAHPGGMGGGWNSKWVGWIHLEVMMCQKNLEGWLVGVWDGDKWDPSHPFQVHNGHPTEIPPKRILGGVPYCDFLSCVFCPQRCSELRHLGFTWFHSAQWTQCMCSVKWLELNVRWCKALVRMAHSSEKIFCQISRS